KELLNPVNRNHRALADELSEKLADKCFATFSRFQSLPDAWGIGQVFPVMPLTGLDRPLSRRGILMDITCDSDGQVEHYVDGLGVESTLPMPQYEENEVCYVGFFLVGAYQEILGDLHNLFGDTHCAEVCLDEEGKMDIRNVVRGDTVDQLLRYVNIDPSVIRENYQRIVSHPALDDATRKALLDELELGLQGYAYLEDE
ncbi:MAG TPA: arginine decarboxylase, partial [Aeromonas salmonicida]|nr:arginine decarboxylase [Aeromonas salmonicida]